jgi:hypothetical protein
MPAAVCRTERIDLMLPMGGERVIPEDHSVCVNKCDAKASVD